MLNVAIQRNMRHVCPFGELCEEGRKQGSLREINAHGLPGSVLGALLSPQEGVAFLFPHR